MGFNFTIMGKYNNGCYWIKLIFRDEWIVACYNGKHWRTFCGIIHIDEIKKKGEKISKPK